VNGELAVWEVEIGMSVDGGEGASRKRIVGSEIRQRGRRKKRKEITMQSREALKAPTRLCRYCGDEIPAQPSSPGRPRAFCSRRCSRGWHGLKERYEREREADERSEADYYQMTRAWYGKRECDRLAREREQCNEDRERIRQQHLEAPWKEKK
jgi:hypothetical protein